MTPIYFPQKTCEIAKDQEEYLTLPAFQNETETISLWQLTWRERFKIFWTGQLWLRQCNFMRPLQPQAPAVDDPFQVVLP